MQKRSSRPHGPRVLPVAGDTREVLRRGARLGRPGRAVVVQEGARGSDGPYVGAPATPDSLQVVCRRTLRERPGAAVPVFEDSALSDDPDIGLAASPDAEERALHAVVRRDATQHASTRVAPRRIDAPVIARIAGPQPGRVLDVECVRVGRRSLDPARAVVMAIVFGQGVDAPYVVRARAGDEAERSVVTEPKARPLLAIPAEHAAVVARPHVARARAPETRGLESAADADRACRVARDARLCRGLPRRRSSAEGAAPVPEAHAGKAGAAPTQQGGDGRPCIGFRKGAHAYPDVSARRLDDLIE